MRGQFVEEMPVYSHSGSDGKVTRARFAFEILVLDSAQRNAPNCASNRNLSRCARAKRSPNVMSKTLCCTKRHSDQRDRRTDQALYHVVNRPIAPAGKHGVASVRDGAACIIGSL